MVSAPSRKLSSEPNYMPPLREVLQDVSHFASHNIHVDSYTSMLAARRKNLVQDRKDVVLINIDTHSDLYNWTQSRELVSSASWMNGVILDNPEISDVVWIRPNKAEMAFQTHAVSPDSPLTHFKSFPTPYVDTVEDIICFNTDLPTEPEKLAQIRPLKVVALTVENLPDMAGRNVMMSLDMDYFSNTGFDTARDLHVPFVGYDGVRQLFQTLADKHVRPFVFDTALSPGYSFTKCWPLPNPLKRTILNIKADIDGIFTARKPDEKDTSYPKMLSKVIGRQKKVYRVGYASSENRPNGVFGHRGGGGG